MRIDKDNIKIILILLILGLDIGYSYLNTDLAIDGTANINSANWSVYWNNVQVSNGSVEAETPVIDTNKTTVTFNVTLEKPGDYYEFTVDAVNAGTLDAMIESINSKLNGTTITSLPAYLEYNVTYSDGVPLELNQELLHDSTETYKVRLAYKDNINASDLPETNQSLSLQFSITYKQANIDAVPVEHPQDPENFSTDSWITIVYAIKNNNTDNYNVGDTKEVDMGTFGTHTLRISNKTTPEECSQEGFSQTACGFVLEFADVITTHNMNSTATNRGGWPASEMRTYVNSDIYYALPRVLRNAIINTYVVSEQGSTIEDPSITSTDKLYLLSLAEICIESTIDGTRNVTRVLDYYEINCSASSRYKTTISDDWWLRISRDSNSTSFYIIYSGWDYYRLADATYGVSPAFRIG